MTVLEGCLGIFDEKGGATETGPDVLVELQMDEVVEGVRYYEVGGVLALTWRRI